MNSIDDLKSIWAEVSQKEVEQQRLDIQSIKKIAQKKSLDSIDRLHRNLYIGLGLIALLIINEVITLHLSKKLIPDLSVILPQNIMSIAIGIDIFNYAIISAIFIFVINKIRKDRKDDNQIEELRSRLKRIISLLNVFKKMMQGILLYFALMSILSFSFGYIKGLSHITEFQNIDIQTLTHNAVFIILTIIVYIFICLLLWAFYYLLMRVLYRKLYGKHLKTFQSTLLELEELETTQVQ